MIITINNLERNTADDTVITAHWSVRLEEVTVTEAFTDLEGNEVPESTTVDYSASAYGSQSFTRDEESAEFIAFEDLTEEIVIGWLTLDEGLEVNLQAQIDEQKTPSMASGVPWTAAVESLENVA
jgi:acyl dehydratase